MAIAAIGKAAMLLTAKSVSGPESKLGAGCCRQTDLPCISLCWRPSSTLPVREGIAQQPSQVQPAALVVGLCVEGLFNNVKLLSQHVQGQWVLPLICNKPESAMLKEAVSSRLERGC